MASRPVPSWWSPVFLTITWVVACIVVNPSGEFPIIDDWAYAKNVQSLVLHGQVVFSNWPAMTLIAQTFWGALACKIFGFSFLTLRMSVTFLAWLGMILFYLIVKRVWKNEFAALTAALLFAFNPWYFSLAYSFMTDSSFLAVAVVALWFYFRYIETEKVRYLLIATAAALVATMIRQFGTWLAFSMIFVTLVTERFRARKILGLALAALFVYGSLALYTNYLRSKGILPASFSTVNDLVRDLTIRKIFTGLVFRGSIVLFYCGILLLPWTVLLLPGAWRSLGNRGRIIVGTCSVFLTFPVLFRLGNIPVEGVMNNFSLGSRILKDTYWGMNLRPVLPSEAVVFFNAVGIAGALLFVFSLAASLDSLIRGGFREPSGKLKVHILIFLAGYMVFVILGTWFFDRYILPVVALGMFLVVPGEIHITRASKLVSVSMLIVLLLFSVLGTRDYFTFSRCRWKALNEMVGGGISPRSIDGGFEFNAWYETGPMNLFLPDKKSWWFVDDDTYVISLGMIHGYKPVKSYRYFRCLPPMTDSLLVLKRREDMDSERIIRCGAEILSPDGNNFLSDDSTQYFSNLPTRSSLMAHSGKYSVVVDKETPFSMTTVLKVEPGMIIHITTWCRYNGNEASLVVAARDNRVLYAQSTDFREENSEWKRISMSVTIPDNYPFPDVVVDIWNHGSKKVWFDDLEITMIRRDGAVRKP
jgi:hypothetical protein